MSRFGNFENLLRLWQDLVADLLPRQQSAPFLIQLAAIAGSGLAAVWLAPRLIRLLKRLLISGLSRPWVQGISNVLASISVPGLWLLFLWLSVETGRSAGLSMQLARDAVSLLVAWVVIRLLSHVVRHPLWSSVIFFAAWSIAALDILGVLGQLEASLDTIALPYGNVRISALNVVRAMIVLGVLLWLATLVRGFIEKRIFHAHNLTPSLQNLVVQLLKLIFPALAILASLPVLGLDLTVFAVFGGALAVGIGLGLQRSVSNFIGGMALLAGGAIKPGDVLAVKNVGGVETYGRVTSIGASNVALRTRAGVDILLPNEFFITNGVENWSHLDHKIRLNIPFGIAYDCDPRTAMRLAVEAAGAVARVVKSPAPVCHMTAFAASSVDFELRVWIEDPMNGLKNVVSDCMLEIWDRFQANGIRIPFPRHDVHVVSRSLDEASPA